MPLSSGEIHASVAPDMHFRIRLIFWHGHKTIVRIAMLQIDRMFSGMKQMLCYKVQWVMFSRHKYPCVKIVKF